MKKTFSMAVVALGIGGCTAMQEMPSQTPDYNAQGVEYEIRQLVRRSRTASSVCDPSIPALPSDREKVCPALVSLPELMDRLKKSVEAPSLIIGDAGCVQEKAVESVALDLVSEWEGKAYTGALYFNTWSNFRSCGASTDAIKDYVHDSWKTFAPLIASVPAMKF